VILKQKDGCGEVKIPNEAITSAQEGEDPSLMRCSRHQHPLSEHEGPQDRLRENRQRQDADMPVVVALRSLKTSSARETEVQATASHE